MADKNYTVTTPEGAIELPAWATEDTMTMMAQSTMRSTLVSRQMLKASKDVLATDKKLLDAMDHVIATANTNADNDKSLATGKAEMIQGAAKAVLKTADFFGDSEKPMTSMVGAISNLASKVNGPDGSGGLKTVMKKMGGLGKYMEKFGGSIGVVSDVALALAGWNAAKFEQFAEVQKSMIDSGAIFYDSAADFDKLYSDSMDAGIKYSQFAETIQNFGGTMTALGGDVSQGSRAFMGMFKTLSDNTDDLGDLGMQNKEMMQMYASYIETQRLVGTMDAGMANQGKGLEDGFKNLVVESTALASVTSLNRGDALNRQMAAISEEMIAAGVSKLEEGGFSEQANVAKKLVSQLSLIKDQGAGTEHMEELNRAINKSLFEYSGDISKYDVKANLSSAARSAFDIMSPKMLDKINQMVRTGEMSQLEGHTYLIKEFANIDQTRLGAAGSAAGSIVDIFGQLQSTGRQVSLNFGELLNLNDVTLPDLFKESAKKQGVAGTVVKAMNDASRMFLQMQDAITLPMASLSSGVKALAEWFEGTSGTAKDSMRNILSGDNIKIASNLKDVTKESITTDMSKDSHINTPGHHVKGPATASVKNELDMTYLVDRLTKLQDSVTISKKGFTNNGEGQSNDDAQKEINILKQMISSIEKSIKLDTDKLNSESSIIKTTTTNY
jgi:hypothetical protein